MNLFEQQNAKGKVGEALVSQYLINKGWDVEDTSSNPDYFKKDIDFLVSKNGLDMAIEVKTEAKMNETGNMFIEDKISYSYGSKPGWRHYCEADYMWHVNPKTQIAFVYKAKDMAELIDSYVFKYRSCNDGFKMVYGYLVPIEKYKTTGYWYQEVNLREIF